MRHTVSVVKYTRPEDSVAEAIDLAQAFNTLKKGDKVFVKPNIVFWSRHAPMPPWGVITTSRVVEDVVRELKNFGAGPITIGEGIITLDPKYKETPAHAFETLGYNTLAKRYGAKVVNLFDRKFRKVKIGDSELNFSEDLLNADFVVNLPVLKTHAQTMVSLSQKNLKGCLDMKTRKLCHSTSKEKNLDFWVASLAGILSRSCTIIDGIYSLERGPTYSGTARRTDLLIASQDMLSADITGSTLLGIDPASVPHLLIACEKRGAIPSAEALDIVGEPIDMWVKPHAWDFPYNKDRTLPINMAFMGIKGLSFPKYDHSLCSYCSGVITLSQHAISKAWKKAAFDKVEILTGKAQPPTPGMNHTILLGKCQINLNKQNEDIKNPILIPGCPPDLNKLYQAFKQVGIEVDKTLFDNYDQYPGLFMERYKGRAEFSETFYRVEP